jgi:hypothetical protein
MLEKSERGRTCHKNFVTNWGTHRSSHKKKYFASTNFQLMASKMERELEIESNNEKSSNEVTVSTNKRLRP